LREREKEYRPEYRTPSSKPGSARGTPARGQSAMSGYSNTSSGSFWKDAQADIFPDRYSDEEEDEETMQRNGYVEMEVTVGKRWKKKIKMWELIQIENKEGKEKIKKVNENNELIYRIRRGWELDERLKKKADKEKLEGVENVYEVPEYAIQTDGLVRIRLETPPSPIKEKKEKEKKEKKEKRRKNKTIKTIKEKKEGTKNKQDKKNNTNIIIQGEGRSTRERCDGCCYKACGSASEASSGPIQ
jgi:hypothetical protein